jgi:oligoribonuclease NrnB/cAMP/cGMP phosphodiesterase (DHH superfamily)
MKPLCIFHANCADGFAAAWCVYKKFGLDFDYHPAGYGSLPPDVTDRKVFIVDFSYPMDTLMFMASMAQSVLVLDHHKTAADDLKDLRVYDPSLEDEGVLLPNKGLWGTFDMARSGAGLTWDYLNVGQPRPVLVNLVEDRDLWKFASPHSRAFHAMLMSYKFDFVLWSSIADDAQDPVKFVSMVREGEAIDRKHLQMCHEVIKSGKHYAELAGYTVPICNAPYFMASDIGNIMSENEPFAATFFINADGSKNYSLRGRGKVDVSEVAKQFGGGGHANAAGFNIKAGEGDIDEH